jgi:hypothetical protein
MINRLHTLLSHTTPIHHYDLPSVIQSKDFPDAVVHTSLDSPNTLPKKWETSMSGQHIIKGSHLRLPAFIGDPTYFIFTTLPQSNKIKKLKERNHALV